MRNMPHDDNFDERTLFGISNENLVGLIMLIEKFSYCLALLASQFYRNMNL